MIRLTRLSLAARAVVVLLSVVVMGVGWYLSRSLKQELIPSIDRPRASIIAVYPGASPESVEREVSKPLEDAVKGVAGVTSVTSNSASGIAQLRAEWDFGTDDDKMNADIRAAADGARTRLPTDVKPQVLAGSFDDVPIVVFSVTSTQPRAQLSRQLREVVVPQLKNVPGVRDVGIAGEEKRQVVVTLRQADVDKHGVAVASLPDLFQANGVVVPAGTMPSRSAKRDVQVGKTMSSVGDIQLMQVPGTDGPVQLQEIADVREEPVDNTTISRSNGRPSITVAVIKEPSGNTVTVSQGAREALTGLIPKLGAGAVVSAVFDQAPYIEDSIHDLSIEGALGLLFAVLVIMVFLRSLRPTLITAISIPTSLFIALIGLWIGKYTLNILTLGALTVAIGRVVDDSIVVIENIKRHHSLGRTSSSDIVAAVGEVAGAVTSSTLTTVAVFAPIAMVSGPTGALFRPFAVTVTIALLASLLVSLTLVPVLASWFMRPSRPAQAERADAAGAAESDDVEDEPVGSTDAPLSGHLSARTVEHRAPLTLLQRGYLPILRTTLAHRVPTLLLALAVFLGTLALTPTLKTDFLGDVGETTLDVNETLPAGTPLTATDAAAKRLESMVGGEPGVVSYQTTVGGSTEQAFFGTVRSSNEASISVTLAAGSKSSQVAESLRDKLSIMKNLGAVSVVPGGGSNQVSLRVESQDPKNLRVGSDLVVAMLHRNAELTNVRSDLTDDKKMLQVDLDRNAATAAGMAQVNVGMAVQQAIKGTKVGTLAFPDSTVDVVLRSRAPVSTVAELQSIPLPVTQKQDADARRAAAERVAAAQEVAAAQQQVEAQQQVNAQIAQIRAGKARAEQQIAALEGRLRSLQQALAAPPPTQAGLAQGSDSGPAEQVAPRSTPAAGGPGTQGVQLPSHISGLHARALYGGWVDIGRVVERPAAPTPGPRRSGDSPAEPVAPDASARRVPAPAAPGPTTPDEPADSTVTQESRRTSPPGDPDPSEATEATPEPTTTPGPVPTRTQAPSAPPSPSSIPPTRPSSSIPRPTPSGAPQATIPTRVPTSLPTRLPSVAPTSRARVALLQQIADVRSRIRQARSQLTSADDQVARLTAGQTAARRRAAQAAAMQRQAMAVTTVRGKTVRLREVATVREVNSLASIGRVDGNRSATVTAMPISADLGGMTSQVEDAVNQLNLPEGVTVKIGGVSQQQRESFAQLGIAMLVAIAIVYLIMVATFGSVLQPLILLVSVPFAATGALASLLLTDTPLGIPAMIGLLMLIGIVVTNAIVLIDLINKYRAEGANIDHAILHGTRLRLRPIVMTALATVFALLPMGLGVTGGGIFVSRPLAVVVIGGLVSSTILTLILVPVLYDLMEKSRMRRYARKQLRKAPTTGTYA